MTDEDARRLVLETVAGHLSGADEAFRCALLKLVQWARTDYEKEIIDVVLEARKEVYKAKTVLLTLHPNSHSSQSKKGS